MPTVLGLCGLGDSIPAEVQGRNFAPLYGDAGLESLGLTGKIGDVGHYTQFKENQKITKTPTYSASGQQVTIINGNTVFSMTVAAAIASAAAAL